MGVKRKGTELAVLYTCMKPSGVFFTRSVAYAFPVVFRKATKLASEENTIVESPVLTGIIGAFDYCFVGTGQRHRIGMLKRQ